MIPALCYLGLGSNIGDSNQNISQAIQLIAKLKNVEMTKSASFYLSKAWGKTDQNDFVNTVIEIRTKLSAMQLLKLLQKIEIDLGRERKEKWGPRIIDIDILTYAEQVINEPQLKVPHPHLTKRSFVIAPLFELNPNINIRNEGLLKNFVDSEKINKEIIDVYLL